MLLLLTLAWAVALTIVIRSAMKWRKKRNDQRAKGGYFAGTDADEKMWTRVFVSAVGGTVVGFFILVPTIITVYSVLECPYNINYQQDKLRITQERYEMQAAMVRAELSKYPEYERAVIDKIDPKIVLSWPNLRASDTLMQMVKTVVELQDDVYEARIELSKLNYDYDFSRNVLLLIP